MDKMTEQGMTVVLGWDALDYSLLNKFDLTQAFGQFSKKIQTFSNPVINEPHTKELWPSMITGVRPEEHGIWAVTEAEGIEWANPLVNWASSITSEIIPQQVRATIGKLLRQRGYEVSQTEADYYATQGIPTVFDGRRSRAICIPNYRTPRDKSLGFTIDRTSVWRKFLEVGGGDEQVVYQPFDHVKTGDLDELLAELAGRRLAIVQLAAQRDYDLIWVWLAYLDSVGHLAPAIDESGWQERHYRQAARWTRQIKDALLPEDTLVCVSDHGLQQGRHTESATIASDSERIVESVSSVLDLRSGIEQITQFREPTDGFVPPVREPYRGTKPVNEGRDVNVQQQLEDLGYI